MARAGTAVARHKRKKKIMARAKGYRAGRHKLYRTAKEAVMRAGRYAFAGRKIKKRDYRALWITRISAALQGKGINYSKFIYGLKKASVDTNRKVISELAISDRVAFDKLVEIAKSNQK